MMPKAPLLLDAHLDLALNALDWNRDLRLPLGQIRTRESGLRDKPGRARGTVSLPEMRQAGAGLCVATQLARVAHDDFSPLPGWNSQEQAWAATQAQLAWYRAMEDLGEMRQIRTASELRTHAALWNASPKVDRLPIGYVLSLEGADSLPTPQHLERAWNQGLRALGPAHYGPGVYAQGTDTTGGFNSRGRDLLRVAGELGLILDVTHLSDACFWEALESYPGPVWASHHNSRALVPHQRQLDDAMVRALAARGAVIGVALDAWMLHPGWQRGITTPESAGVTLETVARHIHHFCQVLGNALHVGIGSDLDGCFGTEQSPADLDSIADLQKLRPLLAQLGFSAADQDAIFHGNFLRHLEASLPA